MPDSQAPAEPRPGLGPTSWSRLGHGLDPWAPYDLGALRLTLQVHEAAQVLPARLRPGTQQPEHLAKHSHTFQALETLVRGPEPWHFNAFHGRKGLKASPAWRIVALPVKMRSLSFACASACSSRSSSPRPARAHTS